MSKQFTAAAIVLLARQGKLSLDDDVRKYLPELPVYARPLTLHRMLTHTSGLRDWGAIEDVAGWPRGSRTYTQAWVLDLTRRQRALNFAPGATSSYSNSNYNLAAIVVERVSHMTFSEFTRQNIFAPLGMTHTRWRDDYTRVVPGRATAYSLGKDHAWHVDMPIEDAIGNGGLLTTVGDLLLWNANFAHPLVGDAAFVTTLETEGVLASGRGASTRIRARCLVVNSTRVNGVGARVSHDGARAGYQQATSSVSPAEGSRRRSCATRGPPAPARALTRCAGEDVFVAAGAGAPRAKPLRSRAAHAPPRSPRRPRASPASTGASAPGRRSAIYGGRGRALQLEGRLAVDPRGHDAAISPSRRSRRRPSSLLREGRASEVLGFAEGRRAGLRRGCGSRSRTGRRPSRRIPSRVAPCDPLDVLTRRRSQASRGEYASDEADARLLACVRDGKLVLLQRPERAWCAL